MTQQENMRESGVTEPIVRTEDSIQNHKNPVKHSKLRSVLLYVLIGGLVISAFISVFAILAGGFNETLTRSLWTTFVLLLHALFVLAIVSTDTKNQLGRAIVSTTILAVTLANLVTTTLGTWNILPHDGALKAFNVYVLLIGTAFAVAAILRLLLKHTVTRVLIYTTVGLVLVLAGLLSLWIIFNGTSWVNEFYYRLIGATSVLASTSFIVAVVMRQIAVSKSPELKITQPTFEGLSSGHLAINITVGVLISFMWLWGLGALITQAADPNHSTSLPYDDTPPRYLGDDTVSPPQYDNQSDTIPSTGDYDPGYRGGPSGVKLTEDPSIIATKVLESIKLTHKQQGQYPAEATEYMTQLWYDHGYNQTLAAPRSLRCAGDDNGLWSYNATRDQQTGEYESFTLDYCRDSKLITKTQADIPQ